MRMLKRKRRMKEAHLKTPEEAIQDYLKNILKKAAK